MSKQKGLFQDAYKLRNAQETRKHYAKWAKTYDQEIGKDGGYRQPERCAKALLNVLGTQNARILDVGCGTGLSGQALNQCGYRSIDGCDLTPEMLAKAESLGVYNQLFEADLNKPPINAGYQAYDAVTAVGVFSYGHVQPEAIDDLLRIIKPGGYLVIGLNDHFYNEGDFPRKLEALEKEGKIEILSREHGLHLENIKDSTGWVIVSKIC